MFTTQVVCIIVAAILVIYDIYIIASKGTKASISWLVWSYSVRGGAWCILPLAWGVLAGHFFWSQPFSYEKVCGHKPSEQIK